MLRIAPPTPPASSQLAPDEGESDLDTAPVVEDSPKSRKYDVQMVRPDTAGYLGPEQGPFECQNCVHWEAPGSCAVVSGPIDPKGVCCLFETATSSGDPDNPDADPEATDVQSAEEAPDAPIQH